MPGATVASDGSGFVLASCRRDDERGDRTGGEAPAFDDDIVLEDGRLAQWPAGVDPG